jgi:hypothetical protein
MNIIRIALATVALGFSFGLTSCGEAPKEEAKPAADAPAAPAAAPAADAPKPQ